VHDQIGLRLGVVAMVGCAASQPTVKTQSGSEDPLTVGRVVRGSTAEIVSKNAGAICTGGYTVGVLSARGYRFTAPATADYRFTLRADYPALVDVRVVSGSQRGRDLACARGTTSLVLREGETYSVTVDGVLQARGAYQLVVEQDPYGRLQPEDPDIARAQIAAAPPLSAGRVLGTYVSVAGGAHASCGGFGGDGLYTLDVASSATLALHAVAQFPIALEIRAATTGRVIACEQGAASHFAVNLARDLAPGRYLVVIDTTAVDSALFDPLAGFQSEVKVPGAAVRGAFSLDVDLATRSP
jgi:hypothetical protein